MNQGSFERNSELLLIHLNNLQEHGKSKKCKATTKYLAKSIGKSLSQTKRYLTSLEDRGLIKRNTSGFMRNTITKKPYKIRTIQVFAVKQPKSKEILGIFFNKNLHGRVKNRLIRQIIKSKDFQLINIENTKEKVKTTNKLRLDLEFATRNFASTQETMINFEEINRIVEANEKKLEEKRFYSNLDTKCEAMLLQLWDTSVPLIGDTPMERLANVCIHNFKSTEKLMEDLDPPDLEMRKLKAKTWASNTVLKDNVFWITIYLGGQIPYELKLSDYLPWDKDSEYYRLFIEAFKEKA